jgi:RsiW-degrading membrane proteinase PrsW (M82 family)
MDIIKIVILPLLATFLLYRYFAHEESKTKMFLSLLLATTLNIVLIQIGLSVFKFELDNVYTRMIINVGLGEELIKFMAFLMTILILKVNTKKEIVVCLIVSHIGFSMYENLIYYLVDNSTIDTRFILTVLIHGGLGVVQSVALFYSRKHFVIAFVLCVLWHGIYDAVITEEVIGASGLMVLGLNITWVYMLSSLYEENIKVDSTELDK